MPQTRQRPARDGLKIQESGVSFPEKDQMLATEPPPPISGNMAGEDFPAASLKGQPTADNFANAEIRGASTLVNARL
jgi:hypothetical protein